MVLEAAPEAIESWGHGGIASGLEHTSCVFSQSASSF